jgi:hypothetical protein
MSGWCEVTSIKPSWALNHETFLNTKIQSFKLYVFLKTQINNLNHFDANGNSRPLLLRTVSYFDSTVRSFLVRTSSFPTSLLQQTHVCGVLTVSYPIATARFLPRSWATVSRSRTLYFERCETKSWANTVISLFTFMIQCKTCTKNLAVIFLGIL